MRLRILLLALAALPLLLPAPASATPKTRFGVDVAAPMAVDPLDFKADLILARRTGARLARFEVDWHRLEPQRGQLDARALDRLDKAVAEATRRGIKPFLLFVGTPCWASSAPAGAPCHRYPPRDAQDAVFAATTVARRYQANAAAFEIWNEPDQRNQLYWAGPDKIRRYVDLTKALYRPLKAAAPKLPVLAGAFVGYDGRWLQALYDAGMKGHYDALSVHFYDLTLRGLRDTRKLMRRNGDRTKVWLGETGWTSCRHRARTQDGHLCTTRASQARQTRDLVRALRRTSWVRGALFYTLRDDQPYDFGLYDRRGRLKPVGKALRSELRTKRPRRARKVRIRVTESSRGIRITGIGPGADIYEVTARGSGVRYRGYTRLTPGGRISVRLPRVLNGRRLTIRVKHLWTKRSDSERV